MSKFTSYPLLFIGTLALLSSCSLKQICEERFPPTPYDSIVTVVKDSLIHDTIYTSYQELTFDTLIPCDPKIIYRKEVVKGGLTGIVNIENGRLSFTCKDDSLKLIINKLQRKIFETRSTQKVITKEIKYTAWYDIACRWLLLIIILVLLLDLLRTIIKNKL